MNQNNAVPVDEGDKIEIDGETGVYVVSWVSSLSVKAKEAGADAFADKARWDPDELAQLIDDGDVRVLNDDEPTTAAGREIREHVDVEQLADRLEGRGGGLRSSKPRTDADDGLTTYCWRMARFHGGHDTSMPVMCAGELQTYVDRELEADASVSGIVDDAGSEVTDQLELAVDAVLVALDEDPSAGVRRWEQTGVLG